MSWTTFEVIVDTRERTGWDFSDYELVTGSVNTKLDTGDYSIVGLEDRICIERKKSVQELAQNVTQDRFKREMERMAEFPHKFLLLEFDMYDVANYPVGSELPKRLWDKLKIKGPYIFSFLDNIQLDYGINVVFCGSRQYAQDAAYRLMKKCHKKNTP